MIKTGSGKRKPPITRKPKDILVRPKSNKVKKRTNPSRKAPKLGWNFHITPIMLRWMTLVASLMVVFGFSFLSYSWINQPDNMAISKVDIRGDLKYIDVKKLETEILPFTTTNLFLLDEQGLELTLEKLPWVRSASLRKVWPQQLEIRLEEQVPIAFWGKEQMLNKFGEIFDALLEEKQGVFPLLHSPANKGRELAERYVYLTRLLGNLQLEIAELIEDETGVWRISFRDGPEVVIGRKEYEKRLSRFKVGYVRELKEQFPKIRRVDLRYTNGFAVEWKQTPVGS